MGIFLLFTSSNLQTKYSPYFYPPKLVFMKLSNNLFVLLGFSFLIFGSCNNKKAEDKPAKNDSTGTNVASPDAPVTDGYDSSFNVEAEAFADLQILRYQVPGFNSLPLQQ